MSKHPRVGATLRDVAERAGVSLATASRVINGAATVDETMRLNVLEAASDLQYDVSEILPRKKDTVILTVLSGSLASGMQSFPCSAATAMGISTRCRELGLQNVLLTLGGEPIRLPEQCAAIFVGTGDEERKALQERLHSSGMPVVLVNRQAPVSGVSTIGPDAGGVLRDAVSYLHGLGHRRIAYLHAVNSISLAELRMDAFREALDTEGLCFDPALVYTGGFDAQTGRKGMAEILSLPRRPSAVLADSDQIAIGAIAEAKAHGVAVPEGLSVLGIDDMPDAAYADPPLTTMRMYYTQTGMEAVNLASGMLRSDGRMEYHVTVHHTLVERKTVAPFREQTEERRQNHEGEKP